MKSLHDIRREAVAAAERPVILATLNMYHWHRGRAAKALGISYRGLLYKIAEYKLVDPYSEEANGVADEPQDKSREVND